MTKDGGNRPRTIDDVDFGLLYREHFAASGGRENPLWAFVSWETEAPG